eukprot:gene1648-biopygen1779
MRLLTAEDSSYFAKVGQTATAITDDEIMIAYCQRDVEPMGKEVEQVQISALCSYLRVQVIIQYLDGRTFESALPSVTILDTSAVISPVTVSLLYRPGHYDIIYS